MKPAPLGSIDSRVLSSVLGVSFAGLLLGTQENLQDLVNRLEDDRPEIREKAANALRKMGKLAIPALSAAQGDENPERSARAREVLSLIKSDLARSSCCFRGGLTRTGCLEAQGPNQLSGVAWSFTSSSTLYSSLVANHDTLFVAEGGEVGKVGRGLLSALNVKDGHARWRFSSAGAGFFSTPTLLDNLLLVGFADRHLYAIDANTGIERWKFKAESCVHSSPAALNGVVYFGCLDGFVYAVDISRGNLKWKYDAGGDVQSSPSVLDGVIYVGSKTGFHALEADSGRLIWKRTGAAVDSTAALDSQSVYYGDLEGVVYRAESKNGKISWRFKTKGAIESSPGLSDRFVFIGSNDKTVYALDRNTGKAAWEHKTRGEVKSSPILANDLLLIGSYDEYLYALDMTTGKERWGFRLESAVHSCPTVVDRLVFVAGIKGELFAL